MDETLTQRVEQLERQLADLSSRYEKGNNPSTQIFTKKVLLQGGLSLNGGSLGSTGDAMSVYGVTPVVQAAAISTPPQHTS